jgi:hypothetical protein
MFCKKGIFVNWGNLPNTEFNFGPVNLFSGGSGSGKTTAADGLQSLMTGVHENLFMYNPGQDETTQRGRGGKQVRTLASYVLGCDDGSYSRPRVTDGYVACVFHPTQGEVGERFTVVMCVRASLDSAGSQRQARQDDLYFLIIPGEELALSDFVKEAGGEAYIELQTELPRFLKKKFGANAVEVYDKKGAYLRRLYGALKGQKGAVSDREAKHAAKSFSNFMAYKPVKSINEFVAKEVLELKDLSEDIRQVSELMKTIQSMETEARQVQQSIAQLTGATDIANDYVQHWTSLCLGSYAESIRQVNVHQNSYIDAKNKQRQNHEAINDAESRLLNNASKKKSLHAQLVTLEAQRQGVSALKDKDSLEEEIRQRQGEITQQAKPLLTQNLQFDYNLQAIKQFLSQINQHSVGIDIPTFDKKYFRQCIQQVVDAGNNTGIDAQSLMTSDWVGIANLENQLDQLIELDTLHQQVAALFHHASEDENSVSLRDQVLSLLNQRQNEQSQLQKQMTSKQKEIHVLEHHRINYPAHVEAAITAIQQFCPEANPCVLCDFIEVIDPKWHMVIEGYLGGARYAIVVDPDYEAKAVRVVKGLKSHRGKRNNAKVIQGEKAQRDAAKLSLPRHSIVEVMSFDHKIVEFYVTASYGNVIRVDDEQALRKTARGVTADGLGSGSYTMFRCDLDDGDLVFGQGARERALVAKQSQLEDIKTRCDVAEKNHRQISIVYDLIHRIKAVYCTDVIKQILLSYRALEQSQRALQNLDLSDYQELERALNHIQENYSIAEEEGDGLQKKIGELLGSATGYDRKIKHLADELEVLQASQEKSEAAVLAIAAIDSSYDTERAMTQAEDQARLSKGDFDFKEQNLSSLKKMNEAERQLYSLLMAYNQTAQTYASIHYQLEGESHNVDYFKSIVSIRKAVSLAYNRLKNNMLVDKYEQISSLKESFNTAFVTNLCHSIYQSINEGKRVLDDLNKELEHHRFGADQERFYFDYQWVPEFYEYYRFFKEVISIPNLGDGTTLFDVELTEKSLQVRDQLVRMLLDNEGQVALNELSRISDYRHYRDYEIFKEPLNKNPIALSTYGTGSGGQLETPAYIIRSAAVTSAFKFNEGHTHCRMVLVDEAFSKMDETRSREVIHYLTQTLGLQLLFIMPTSKSGPFLDLISHQVVFSKCPTEQAVGELKTQVLVDRKVCNTEKIQALWAQHRRTVRSQATLDFMEDFI